MVLFKNGLIFISFFLVLISTSTISCSLMSPSVDVKYHSADSTRYEILPIIFLNDKESSQLKASFDYYRPIKGRTVISCTFSIQNDLKDFVVQNAGINTDKVNYIASTFDIQPVKQKGKESFEHILTFFVPEIDFNKMLEANKVELKINNSTYLISQKKWANVKKTIEEKQLMNNS